MAIYRPARRRWRVVGGGVVAGTLLGLLIGFLVWGRQDPDPVEALSRVRSSLQSAAATLEVVGVEYRESVRDGQVVRETEYRGAQDALSRSEERFAEARPALELIEPDTVRRIERGYDDLAGLIAERTDAREVDAALQQLRDLVETAIAGSG